jgi:hypothetical protein
MIPFFALVTPDHELPPVWFPTNTIKFIPIPTFIFEAPLLLVISLGREIGLPAELMFGSPGNTGHPEGDQYVGELQTAIEGAHRVARETLKQSQKRMKRE